MDIKLFLASKYGNLWWGWPNGLHCICWWSDYFLEVWFGNWARGATVGLPCAQAKGFLHCLNSFSKLLLSSFESWSPNIIAPNSVLASRYCQKKNELLHALLAKVLTTALGIVIFSPPLASSWAANSSMSCASSVTPINNPSWVTCTVHSLQTC